MRIYWSSNPDFEKSTGNSVGYARSIVLTRDHLRRMAHVQTDTPEGADVHVCFHHPTQFKPIDGMKNVLFTMCEHEHGQVESQNFSGALSNPKLDLVITPSEFCRQIFKPYTTKPIELAPLGVDTNIFTYRKRRWNEQRQPFRWLTVGAPNQRKFTILFAPHGDSSAGLWERFLAPVAAAGRIELYCKTSGTRPGPAVVQTLATHGVAEVTPDPVGVFSDGGLTVDNRKISEQELIDLYHSAHGFLFLTGGEGWGLTLAEAMATGLPCVFTDYSSVKEFANRKNAYPVGARVGWMEVEPFPGGPTDHRIWAALPRPLEVLRAMDSIMGNYPRAVQVGRQARADMEKFTWERTARSVLDAVKRHVKI